MSYISSTLEPGELVVYRARMGMLSYLGALFWFLLTFSPGALAKAGSTELALTDRRVIGKHGLLMQNRIAVPYKDLQRIHVSRGLLGRVFGYGIVTVIGRDGQQVKFKGIARPMELRRRADEFIEMAVLGRRLPNIEDLPEVDIPPPPPAPPQEPRLGEGAPAAGTLKKTPILPKKPRDPTVW